MRILASFLFTLCACAAPALAECDVELKPTDGYRELSEKLKCLRNEIAALKQAGSTGAMPAALQRPAAAGSVTARGGALVFEFQKCNAGSVGRARRGEVSIICHFKVTNNAREDQVACLTSGSRLVLDGGAAFSGQFYASVGSKSEYIGSGGTCDTITPLSQVSAWISFPVKEPEQIQFLRVMCGADCKYEAYDVPIN